MRGRRVYLSLGSNLGDRLAQLEWAAAALERKGIAITRRSSVYETEPQDMPDQPLFLNQVLQGEAALFPRQLLTILQRIEREGGRTRSVNAFRGPRTIDIDILLFGTTTMETPDLTIPHPRMLDRRFVLEPLVEIAPNLRHPVTHELFSGNLAMVLNQRVRRRPFQRPGYEHTARAYGRRH